MGKFKIWSSDIPLLNRKGKTRFPAVQDQSVAQDASNLVTGYQTEEYLEGMAIPLLGTDDWRLPLTMLPGSSTVSFAAGTYYAVPFFLHPGDDFSRVLAEITTAASAATNIRLGVYKYDKATKLPGARILDSGSIVKTAAELPISTTPIILPLGAAAANDTGNMVALVIQTDQAFAVRRGTSGPSVHGGGFIKQAVGAAILSGPAMGWTQTGSFGAMPATFAGTWTPSSAVPALAILK